MSMKPLDQPDELRSYYRDQAVVDEYLERRTAQPLNGVLHQGQVAFLNRVVAERGPARLLEIAPGPARLTMHLNFRGRGVCLDASPAMLSAAGDRLRNHPGSWLLIQGDAFALPFGDGSFDLIYTTKFIRHFRIDRRRPLYAEIRRLLKPGGAFVMDAQNRAVSLPHRMRKGMDRYRIYDVLYNREELRTELEEAGFRLICCEGILKHFSVQQPLNRLRRVGLAPLARLCILTLERLPGGQPSTWMVLGERR